MVILENILQKYKRGRHKVLIFSQMFFVLYFLEDLLRVKQFKYERLYGSKSASYQAGAVGWFFRKSYQRFVIILRKVAGELGLDLPAADINAIFDHDWNP